jgi:hypothetical protein
MPKSAATALDDIAGELYGLPQTEFTAARTVAAKQARQAGDAELAAKIDALRKPNAVAWLANQLVRQHSDEIEPLLELGARLREATAGLDGDQLRRLSVQQHEVVAALVRQARLLADRPVSEATARGLEDTLHAALADADAAAQLSGGRLTEGMSRMGFPGLDAVAGLAPERQPAPRPQSTGRQTKASGGADDAERRRRTEQVKAAREGEGEAREAAQTAQAASDDAMQEVAEAERVLVKARNRVDELKQRLEQAYDERGEADRRLQSARREAQQADRHAQQTARKLANATEKRVQAEAEL